MSNIETYSTKEKLLQGLTIPSYSRQVLVKTINKTTDARSKSGIWLIGDTEWNESVHANRVAEVVALPKRLPFKLRSDLMPWETKIEITKGWIVWVDYLSSLNCQVFEDEDKNEYKLLNYDDLYVGITPKLEGEDFDEQVTKDGKFYVRPLNGYHLFEVIHHENNSQFAIHKQGGIDSRYGIVRYLAKNNTAYDSNMSKDHVELQVGDKVRFGSVPQVMLEEETYASFDGGTMYRRSQSRNIELVWRDGKIILPNGRIMIKQLPDETTTPAGIILPKPNVKQHTGMVHTSSHGEIPKGSKISYIKGAGQIIKHEEEDYRIVKESEVLYIH